jgi:HSP20 family molecular chaperone IbpA
MAVAQAPLQKSQAVPVVEAAILDTMNETRELIAQRAYEIYESRGRAHGSDQEDWFAAEGEILPRLPIEYREVDGSLRLTAQVPTFKANDLEVILGHQRAVLCGVQSNLDHASDDQKRKRIMRIVELPFEVDPICASATLQSGTLEVTLRRRR